MSDLPTINHPTDRPNLTEVTVGDVTIWFSYRTPVGFMAPGWGRVTRRNEWGPTTGRHLNIIDGGHKSTRVDGTSFAELLELAMAGELPATTMLEEVDQ